MARFPGVDYLQFDSLLNEQELMVRQTARQFVDDQVLPVVREAFNSATFPKQLIPEMGKLGFFGREPRGLGCAGLNNVEYGLIMQELERGDSGLRSFVSVQGALVMYPIYTFGSDEQKRALAAATAVRGGDWLFRADRARFRIESFGHATLPREAREPVGPEWRKDLDYERFRCGHRRGLGAHAEGHSRISG